MRGPREGRGGRGYTFAIDEDGAEAERGAETLAAPVVEDLLRYDLDAHVVEW